MTWQEAFEFYLANMKEMNFPYKVKYSLTSRMKYLGLIEFHKEPTKADILNFIELTNVPETKNWKRKNGAESKARFNIPVGKGVDTYIPAPYNPRGCVNLKRAVPTSNPIENRIDIRKWLRPCEVG